MGLDTCIPLLTSCAPRISESGALEGQERAHRQSIDASFLNGSTNGSFFATIGELFSDPFLNG